MPDHKKPSADNIAADSMPSGSGQLPDRHSRRPHQANAAFVVRRRLFNAWISQKHTNLHLLLAILFLLSFLTGKLLESSAVSGALAHRLQSVGSFGLFGLLLLLFLHQNLYGSCRFLAMFHDADHLPKKQLGEVSFFCMLFLLTAGALLMAGGAWLAPLCWSALARLFTGKPVTAPAESPVLYSRTPQGLPDLSSLAKDTGPAPAWVQALDRLLYILGIIFIAVLLLSAFLTAARKLYRFLTHKRQWDDDEKIRLTPSLLRAPHTIQKPAAPPFHSGHAASPGERLRKHYRKKIITGLRQQHSHPAPGASPAELEASAALHDPMLHQLYEKARYSHTACTTEDLKSLAARSGKER